MPTPFSVRSFRFQWPADLATSWAFEMEALILGWTILSTTGSVEQLVLFGSLTWLGSVFSPFFGVLGDRIGFRALLCATRAGYDMVGLAAQVLAHGLDILALSPERNREIALELFRAAGAGGMIGGQALDLEAEARSLPMDALEEVHRRFEALVERAAVAERERPDLARIDERSRDPSRGRSRATRASACGDT